MQTTTPPPQHPGAARRGAWPVLCLALVGMLAAVAPAGAVTLMRVQELPDLVEESTRAFLGSVTAVRHGADERGLPSTWVTLRVEDALYGTALPDRGDEFTVKLFGTPRPLANGSRFFVDGTPLYAPGQRYLLLLIRESRWGFTSAAGLFQGAFAIERSGRVAGVTAADRVFGKAGLESLVAGLELSPDERRALAKGDEPLPYALLRRAVTELHRRRGGVPLSPPDNRARSDGATDTVAAADSAAGPSTDGPHWVAAPGGER